MTDAVVPAVAVLFMDVFVVDVDVPNLLFHSSVVLFKGIAVVPPPPRPSSSFEHSPTWQKGGEGGKGSY